MTVSKYSRFNGCNVIKLLMASLKTTYLKIRQDAECVVVFGIAGDDTITGSALGDCISGGPGKDVIYGEDGDDYIMGGVDADFFLWSGK
jgi:Ca2+-binding RTX toxin-like protein